MLPGLRFAAVAIVLSMSTLIFGLGAAALLRSAHEQFASLPGRHAPPEPRFGAPTDTTPRLALLRVEPSEPAPVATPEMSAAAAPSAEPPAAETPAAETPAAETPGAETPGAVGSAPGPAPANADVTSDAEKGAGRTTAARTIEPAAPAEVGPSPPGPSSPGPSDVPSSEPPQPDPPAAAPPAAETAPPSTVAAAAPMSLPDSASADAVASTTASPAAAPADADASLITGQIAALDVPAIDGLVPLPRAKPVAKVRTRVTRPRTVKRRRIPARAAAPSIARPADPFAAGLR